MGQFESNNSSNQNLSLQQYLDTLIFSQNIQDERFGHVEIFRMKQAPFQYLMNYQKRFMQGDIKYVKHMKNMKELKKFQHKNLAKIHFIDLKQENHLCIKDKKTMAFYNYYNFTLADAIKKKKKQQAIFTQAQLIYIMSSLINLALDLKKINISIGQYRTQSIYLSPQGYIKLYLLQIDEHNRQSCYYKVLTQRNSINQYVLAPQQLYFLSQMQYQIKYDIYKADLFCIGMIIFQLIVQDQIKFYYNNQKNGYKYDRIYYELDSQKTIYSSDFLKLLRDSLIKDPRNRCQIQNIKTRIQKIIKNQQNGLKSKVHCIRWNNQIQKKKKTQTQKQNLFLSPRTPKQCFKKLTPSPITTFSTCSTNFRMNKRVSQEVFQNVSNKKYQKRISEYNQQLSDYQKSSKGQTNRKYQQNVFTKLFSPRKNYNL